jgi:hydrogenase expression/formation protein HypC
MCLALPAQVISLHGDGTATVSLGGLKKVVSLALVEGVVLGDFVVVHTGFALSRIDAAEADRTIALLRAAGAAAEVPS